MADDDIEIGEDIEVDVVVDADGKVVGSVVDDLVVASGPQGSLVDETIDVLDTDGNLLMEDEKVSVYNENSELVAEEETVTIALDSSAKD
jgi:hypothetical protein